MSNWLASSIRLLTGALLTPLGGAAAMGLIFSLSHDIPNRVDEDENTIQFEAVSTLSQNIAYRTGMIRLTTSTERATLEQCQSNSRIKSKEYLWVPTTNPIEQCTNDDLIKAIATTESYLRPAWRRDFEESVSITIGTIVGKFPDWSYGPAQVKPSTALKIMSLAVDDLIANFILPSDFTLEAHGVTRQTLARSLISPEGEGHSCLSITLAELLLVTGDGETPEDHALRHIGGRSIPTIPGIVEYSSVVAAIANELSQAEQNLISLRDGCDGDEMFEFQETQVKYIGGTSWKIRDGICYQENSERAALDTPTMAFMPLNLEEASNLWLAHQIYNKLKDIDFLLNSAVYIDFLNGNLPRIVPAPVHLTENENLSSCRAFIL